MVVRKKRLYNFKLIAFILLHHIYLNTKIYEIPFIYQVTIYGNSETPKSQGQYHSLSLSSFSLSPSVIWVSSFNNPLLFPYIVLTSHYQFPMVLEPLYFQAGHFKPLVKDFVSFNTSELISYVVFWDAKICLLLETKYKL